MRPSRIKIFLLAAAAALVIRDAEAQAPADDPCIQGNEILRFSRGGKTGWITQAGRVLPDSIGIERIRRFEDGLAIFSAKGKEGVIDSGGTVVIPPQYDELKRLRDRPLAVFRGSDGRYGVLDIRDGRVLVDAKFAKLSVVGNSAVFSVDGKTEGYLEVGSWKVTIPPKFEGASSFVGDYAEARISGKYGLIDRSGKWVIRPEHESLDFFSSWGLARIRTLGLYGFLNLRGQVVLLPRLTDVNGDLATMSSGGKYSVVRMPWTELAKASEPIELEKHVVVDGLDVEPKLFAAGREPYLPIVRNGKHGVVNNSGIVVVEPRSQQPIEIRWVGKSISALKIDGRWAVADESLRLVTAPVFDAYGAFSDSVVRVRQGDKWGLVNNLGKFVQAARFDEIEGIVGGLARFVEGKRIGILQPDGSEVQMAEYDAVMPASEGLAAVLKDGKWGFVGAEGLRLAPTFEWVRPFRDGLAAVTLGGRWGFVGTDGKLKIQPIYAEVNNFRDGDATVSLAGRWGIIDAQGKYLVQPSHATIRPFHEGRAIFRTDRGVWGFLDPTFKSMLLDQAKDEPWPFRNGRTKAFVTETAREYTCLGHPIPEK